MAESQQKDELRGYLQRGREAMLWKLHDLSEYDIRRPLVPTGTNLLGLVKHLTGIEIGYFGDTFDRPFDEPLSWYDNDDEPNADLWATRDESREQIVELYRRAWAHSDETIAEFALDAEGLVPWWPADDNRVSLHRILIHVIAETQRHAGHADIVRELIDGAVGLRQGNDNLPDRDEDWWAAYRVRVEDAARSFTDG